jgi:hypothetical protein
MSISIFNDNSLSDFKRNIENGIYALGSSENNKQLIKGEKVMLYNNTTKKIFGIGIVASPPTEKTLIDKRPLYREDKYNKYEICLRDIHMFREGEELDYTEILLLLKLPSNARTYMTHFQHLMKSGIKKFNIWDIEKEEKQEKIKLLSLWMSRFIR